MAGTQNASYAMSFTRGGGLISYGYPEGVTLMDLLPDDVKPLIHEHWNKFPPVNPMWHYLLAGIYIILSIMSLFGNGIVMYIFGTKKSLRSPANLLVVNLAFSDFMMMVSQYPMFIINCFDGGYWTLGAFACELHAFTAAVFGVTSLLTLVAIGYDRYCVIVKSFDSTMTTGKAITMIVCAYSYAIVITMWPFFGWNRYIPEGILTSCSFDYITQEWNTRSYCIFLFTCCFCIPNTLMVFVYSQIVVAIRNHEKALREQAKRMGVESLRSNVDLTKQSVEVRIAKCAVSNVFLWLITWTPYAYIILTGVFGDQEILTPIVSALPGLICKTASVYNPVMFAISHPKFRLALQEAWPWFCVNEPKDDDSKSVKTAEAEPSK